MFRRKTQEFCNDEHGRRPRFSERTIAGLAQNSEFCNLKSLFMKERTIQTRAAQPLSNARSGWADYKTRNGRECKQPLSIMTATRCAKRALSYAA
jgi:hypothetical protein